MHGASPAILNCMHKPSYYVINGITLYRLLIAPVLVYLIIAGDADVFKWLLPISFFTDLIDGYLARRYKVTSILGSRIDSVADDLTIVAAIVGVFVLKPAFVREQIVLIVIMLVLYLIQLISALIRYKKISSFHTYSAKVAAILQGVFLILIFLWPGLPAIFFYLAAISTLIDLAEEIVLVYLLPDWQTDVKGIYWLLKG